MLQDRNTNVKVDAWIKQFNEEQKVQDQRIANLEETEKTVQNATCFDGCTSAQWKDYIANNPATDITADSFSVHNNTSEIKMGSNVELKSGSSKVDVDNSSVTNETQFTNQFSEVSKAKTEIYSGDDSTHFEAKAECGPEGKSSCIRVSADYSLLHTSTSNTDFGNYYFSNQKAEFTFPNHCFEFCCDGLFFIDGQPSSVTNAICFDGCDSDCWRDYIAAQIPSKAQDTYCFDGCDATCWRNYIDSHAGNPSSITSPDGCALVTTICNGNQIYICDPTFTLCTIPGYIPSGPTCVLLLEGRTNCSMCITVCSDDEYNEVCTQINAFSYGERVAELFIGTDQPSGGGGVASIWSTLATVVSSRRESCICANCRNIMMSPVNCICASCCNDIRSYCKNCICAYSSSGPVQNVISALSGSSSGQNFLNAKTSNYLQSSNYNLLQASCYNSFHASCCNEIQSGIHCWVFCCDGNLYKDGSEFSVSNATCFDGCDAACWRAYINNNIQSCICLGTRKVALTGNGLCVNDGRLCFEYKCCSQGGSYYDCYATLSLYDDPPSDGASFLRIQNTNGLSRNFIELVASNAIYLCGNVRICCGNHCWEFCCDGNLYKDGVCVL